MSDILRLSLPLTLWLATFSSVYGLHGFLCSSRFAENALLGGTDRLLLIGAGLLAIGLQATCLLSLRSPRWGGPPGFARRIALRLGVLAFFATLWTLVPIIATSHCQ
ncbi:MAG: hypothetical protein ACTS3R_15485 [Inquilinaceae bacterium]